MDTNQTEQEKHKTGAQLKNFKQQGIGTPVINEVVCHGQEVRVSWLPARGAKKHILKVDGLGEEFAIDIDAKNLNPTFDVKNSCHYGKMCKFTIEAAGDVEETTRSNSKQALIGGDLVTDVVAKTCEECPGRMILVSWKKPKLDPQGYCLQLREVNNNKQAVEVNPLESAQSSYRFVRLKSSTQYQFEVFPIYRGIKGIGTLSNLVTTTKITRTEGFDIKEHGKPRIIECSAVLTNDRKGLVSQFAWKMPRLDVEEHNYDVVGMKAVFKKDGKETVLNVETGTEAQKVPLMFGTTYEFSVKRVYQDLDKHGTIEAVSKRILHTDISTPVVNEVMCHGQEVTVSWSSAEGATKHIIIVDGLAEQLTEKMKENKPSCVFKVKEPRDYGKMCTITIEATGGVNKTSQSIPKQALIGGVMAVTNVVADICEECPRRKVVVKWKSPKTELQGYSLHLYKMKDGHNEKVKEVNLQQTQTMHQFVELKTSTSYYCVVIPTYKGKEEIGSFSNKVTTARRVPNIFENDEDFGKPGEVISLIKKTSKSDGCLVELSWKMKDIGENFKLSHYQLVVNRSTRLNPLTWFSKTFDLLAFDGKLLPTVTKAEIPKLEMGFKYSAKLTSTLIDLDTEKESSKTKEHPFATEPSKTKMNDCKSKGGLVSFSWEPVDGAQQYRLIMKDELLKELIANDEIVAGDKCEVEVQTTEKLCVGRTCMTKVIVSANEMTSESDWKAHLIGGNVVPRNVKASRNSDNPRRSILVTFDAPNNGPEDQYKIVAIPRNGKQKTFFCKNSPLLIGYLRKGVKYKFEVHAKQGEKWSEGSPSNFQETDRDTPPLNFSITGGEFHALNSSFYGTTTNLNVPQGDDFGKVRDLVSSSSPHERNEVDNLTLSWKVPSFGNKAFDYKVEKYKVEIRKDSHIWDEFSIDFKEGSDTYSITKQEVDLGETYEIFVSVIYNDIDQDKEYTSSAEKTKVLTRPCKPTVMEHQIVKTESGADALKIEWNAAKLAAEYEVEIYTDESLPDPLYTDNTKNETKWSRPFVDGFEYGTSYYAAVKAIKENKWNSTKTIRNTIGEDLSPKKVRATCEHDYVLDPNAQVYLSWMQPPKVPESYEISYENCGETKKIICKETEYLIDNLKAGDYYIFKVVAIFKKTRSSGCLSNKIQTNPTPTQVKNVFTSPGYNLSSSVKIYWDKVEAEKKDESTEYRVTITSVDKATSRVIQYVAEDYLLVSGLEPDTEYFTTVAGGNSIGLGKDSEKVFFKTDRGTPKDVELLNHVDEEMQSTSLLLKFTDAEGGPLKHVGSLYKCQNEYPFQPNVEVKSGHIFIDLEPNTEYFAKVHAVFEDEKQGKNEKSGMILTAPSKPEIYKYHCCIDNKMNSSKDLLLKWKSDDACTEHEIQIKHGDEVENLQTVNNRDDLRYSCQHEASRYTARVRTKNILFGPWSDEVIIDLAPKKIVNVTAKLKEDGRNIVVQCDKATSGSLSYFCQAICEDQNEGNPMMVEPKESDIVIEFIFKPSQNAMEYDFNLWAVNKSGLKGQTTVFKKVMTRPGFTKTVNVTKIEENSSMDVAISWEAIDRCDGYEIKIKKSGEHKPETIVRTTETNCLYRCQSPGSKYGVRVRGLCSSVRGYWSAKKFVELVPEKVINVTARLESDGSNILIQCNKTTPGSLSYFCQAFCNSEAEGKPMRVQPKEADDIVNFTFEPAQHAGKYHFELWAEDNDGLKGLSTFSENVLSRPALGKHINVKKSENPSTHITITWGALDGCDEYEIEITKSEEQKPESCIRTTAMTCAYICQCPGNRYSVCVRGICSLVCGYWSEKIFFELAPAKVQIIEDGFEQEPDKSLRLKWKELEPKPDDYHVVLYHGEEKVREEFVKSTEHVFKDMVKPGLLYYCTVAGRNAGGPGKPSKTKNYRITPRQVKNVYASPGEKPSTSIKIYWDKVDAGRMNDSTTYYRVMVTASDKATSQEMNFVKDNSVEVFELDPDTEYFATVAGGNSMGLGKNSRKCLFKTGELSGISHSFNNNGLVSEISWDAVDVGENFEVEKYFVQVYEYGNNYSICHLRDDFGPEVRKADLLPLRAGKKFRVDLSITCKDLNSGEKITRMKNFLFSTRPNAPNLKKCECSDGAVTFHWETVAGAEKYHIVVEDSQTKSELGNTFVENCQTEFKISDKLCVGKRYKIILRSIANQLESKTNRKIILIGGCYAVENVIVTSDSLNVLTVNWKSPEVVPEAYQIQIYEVDANNGRKVIKETTTKKQTYKFTDIKNGSSYTCKVSPIYGGVIKDGSYSNQIKMDQGPAEEEEIEDVGDHAPRKVEASLPKKGFLRNVEVTFEDPKKGKPDEYKVVPYPSYKINNIQYGDSSPLVVEYLRLETEYYFEVSARFGKKWSKISRSNSVTTPKRKGPGLQDIHDVKGNVTVNMSYASLTGGSNVNTLKPLDFGQVVDLEPVLENNGDNDLMTLKWKIPVFGHNAADYKVEKYEVQIKKIHSGSISFSLDFIKDKLEYCTEGNELELGATYEISLSTIYIDIDEDEEYRSSAVKCPVVTRPCQPTVTCNKITGDGKLLIEWNHTDGADHYLLSVYTDNLNFIQPQFRKNTGKETFYHRNVDEDFGFGGTYNVVIDAIGCDGKTNSTTKTIIGGDCASDELEENIPHDEMPDLVTQCITRDSLKEEPTILTTTTIGPSTPEITDYGCCSENDEFSSRDLFLRWKEVKGCSYEVRITRGNGKTEKEIAVHNECEVTYSCQLETFQYGAEVRAKNIVYGDWSDKKIIDLGPTILEDFDAKLHERNSNIIIKCRKMHKGPLQYCMQALCDGVIEGEVTKQDHESINGSEVNFIYTPQKHATPYSFQLWGETPEHLMGKKNLSNEVISRPQKVKNISVEPADDDPSAKIKINWDGLERCDAYEVWIQCNNSAAPELVLKLGSTTFEYVCKKPGNKYLVRIRGFCGSLGGEWSEDVFIFLVPGMIKGLSLIVKNGEMIYHWDPIQPQPIEYLIRWKKDDKIFMDSTKKTEFKAQLVPGVQHYELEVAASNNSGKGRITALKSFFATSADQSVSDLPRMYIHSILK